MARESLKIKGAGVFPIKYLSSGSKSYSHRFVILAYLLGLDVEIYNFSLSEDSFYTLRALYDHYSLYKIDDCYILKIRSKDREKRKKMDVGESGSTLRFLVPLMLDGQEHTFYGHENLFKRPLDYYVELFEKEGIEYCLGQDYLKICGKLKEKYYRVETEKSSQFASAMLMASVKNQFQVEAVGENSRQYVLQTEDAIKLVRSLAYTNKEDIKIRNPYDMSNRALFLALDYFGKVKGSIPYENGRESGDSVFSNWIKDNPRSYHLKNNIDLAPVLAGFLSIKSDRTGHRYEMSGLENLVFKESNRLYEIKRVLDAFGRCSSIVKGKFYVGGKKTQSKNIELSVTDHRICHLALLLASVYPGEVIIDGIHVLKKSHIELYHYLKRRVGWDLV